jgi:hypothetical protein
LCRVPNACDKNKIIITDNQMNKSALNLKENKLLLFQYILPEKEFNLKVLLNIKQKVIGLIL